MKQWPVHLFRAGEALGAALAVTVTGLAVRQLVHTAAELPVPGWAWALLTAAPAAALTALWADLPRWLTTWLNWRAEKIALIQQRWGLPAPSTQHKETS